MPMNINEIEGAHDRDISPDVVREIFSYNPDSGALIFNKRARKWFKTDKAWTVFNKRFAGKETGSIGSNGYLQTDFLGKKYLTHRIAWICHYGAPIADKIDHWDRNRLNNRIANLSAVPDSFNRKNLSISKTNTSGVVGVYWSKRQNKWGAFITENNKQRHLGFFDTKSEASESRANAELLAGFHPNHGKSLKQHGGKA
jgi:hypothetical protein